MEYAYQVWDPYLINDQKALESVQKFACILATPKWDNSYDDLLNLIDLKLLSERRTELKLGLQLCTACVSSQKALSTSAIVAQTGTQIHCS